MKKIYNSPVCETVVINGADIITTSFSGSQIKLFEEGYGDAINLGEYDFE